MKNPLVLQQYCPLWFWADFPYFSPSKNAYYLLDYFGRLTFIGDAE